MSTTPLLSIVIPAFNEERYIAGCLESVKAEIDTSPHTIEVLVVNNASTDETETVVQQFPFAQLVREPHKGLTHARQRGFIASSGSLIANIDADMHLPRGWVARVITAFEKDARSVCVSGPQIHYDLGVIGSFFVWLYWSCLALPSYWIVGYMAVGGNFTVRRAALESIGGFDTTITFYGEDTNIARRLSKVGTVQFALSQYIYTSARRLKSEGLLQTAYFYILNFISEVILQKPVTTAHNDIR